MGQGDNPCYLLFNQATGMDPSDASGIDTLSIARKACLPEAPTPPPTC